LAELVGTDVYWVQAAVPVDRLKWIEFPGGTGGQGLPALVKYAGEYERSGVVVNLLGDLDPDGRLARVLVEVDDPLDLAYEGPARPPLLLGDYVKVEIQGRPLTNVIRIPRTALREGEQVWVVGEDGRLEVRAVDIVWRDLDSVLLREGLADGDRLIVSDLPTAVSGMQVRVEGAARDQSPAGRPPELEAS